MLCFIPSPKSIANAIGQILVITVSPSALPDKWDFVRLNLGTCTRLILNAGSYLLGFVVFTFRVVQVVNKRTTDVQRTGGNKWLNVKAFLMGIIFSHFAWSRMVHLAYFVTCSYYPWTVMTTVCGFALLNRKNVHILTYAFSVIKRHPPYLKHQEISIKKQGRSYDTTNNGICTYYTVEDERSTPLAEDEEDTSWITRETFSPRKIEEVKDWEKIKDSDGAAASSSSDYPCYKSEIKWIHRQKEDESREPWAYRVPYSAHRDSYQSNTFMSKTQHHKDTERTWDNQEKKRVSLLLPELPRCMSSSSSSVQDILYETGSSRQKTTTTASVMTEGVSQSDAEVSTEDFHGSIGSCSCTIRIQSTPGVAENGPKFRSQRLSTRVITKKGYCGRCWRTKPQGYSRNLPQFRLPRTTRSGRVYGPPVHIMPLHKYVQEYGLN